MEGDWIVLSELRDLVVLLLRGLGLAVVLSVWFSVGSFAYWGSTHSSSSGLGILTTPEGMVSGIFDGVFKNGL